MAKRQQDKVRSFRSVKANPGIRASYRRAMDAMIRQMHEDVMRDVLDEYGALEPRIARDSAGPWKSPMERMTERLRILTDRWTDRFRLFSTLLAKRFVGGIKRAVKNNREQALKDAGMGIRLNPSRLYNERVQALIQGNVDLIRSIPQEHMERVKVQVNNAVAQGLDRGQLARQLQHGYGVTERRAKTIARDQTNKATASIAEATDESLGVTEGIWIHVPGRKMSRPTHVAMEGKRFKLSEGLYDPDPKVRRKVKPGELILCFPGNAEFNVFCGIEKLYRRWYAGKLTELVTDDGAILSATPNHPILTLEGWKPAQALNLGDHIVEMGNESLFVGGFNGKNAVAKFSQLDEALRLLGAPASVLHGSSGDFHGDGADGDVDVVDVRGLLADMLDAEGCKVLRELVFAAVDVNADGTGFTALCHRLAKASRSFGSPTCSIGRLCDALALLRSHMGEAVEACFLQAAALYAIGNEPACDNGSAKPKLFGNGILGDAGSVKPDDFGVIRHDALAMLRNLNASSLEMFAHSIRLPANDSGYQVNGIPRLHKLNTLVKRFDREFSGHVYNLHTFLGWYTINSCIVKNCACRYRPVWPESWGVKTK